MTATQTIDPRDRLEQMFAGQPFPDPDRHEQVADLAARRAASEPSGTVHRKLVDAVETESKVTGEFTALISDFDKDRQGERFAPGAFDNALRKLRRSGRPVPILFGHEQGNLHSVLGMVPADGFWTDRQGLHAKGWIDVTKEPGMKLYELLRRDVLAWSIGFSLKSSKPGRDGVRVLTEVDELLELSAVAVPANPRTRTAQLKHDKPEPPTLEELADRIGALGLEDPEGARLREEAYDTMFKLLTEDSKTVPTAAELHARVEALGIETKAREPIRIATFEA
jgi:HK97 family phage prohead protease